MRFIPTCEVYFLDCSGLFWGQQNCSNFFPETFLFEEKKNIFNFNSNSHEKFVLLSGKIFLESKTNFSCKLELELKLIFFLQVEKSQEKDLNNSVVPRKVQNNPEKEI